jgi:hypothetical protein
MRHLEESSMSSKTPRAGDRPGIPDQRRTSDRRSTVREGDGHARGRRATDITEARSAASTGRAGNPARTRRSTRDGRQPLVVYLRPEAIKALKMAALEGDTTASAIVASAVDGWLRGNGRGTKR